MKNYISERASVDTDNYDFAKLDKYLKKIKIPPCHGDQKLESNVYKLTLKYIETLDKCGYDKFVETQPKLAIKHIIRRIPHQSLQNRMKLTMKLKEEELEKNFKFIR